MYLHHGQYMLAICPVYTMSFQYIERLPDSLGSCMTLQSILLGAQISGESVPSIIQKMIYFMLFKVLEENLCNKT
jgi:hypothetical protein